MLGMTDEHAPLYPPVEPYDVGKLAVNEPHTLHYAQYGNPSGTPVVFLHGGPGSATKPKHAQFFNPDKYRIILFDQRGCGQSTPAGSLEKNTTPDLVADLEQLRRHLQVRRWHVFGGSWGSTLALAYAQKHPDKVSALIVYGIFTADDWMGDWSYGEGQDVIFPEEFELFQQALEQPEDLRQSVVQNLLHGTPEQQRQTSQALSRWHLCAMNMVPEPYIPPETPEDMEAEILGNRLFVHYESHSFFLKDGQLLANAHKLAPIPGIIIHGRYDMCCPAKAAWQLHRAWPQAEFKILPDASHRTESPLAQALIAATDKFAEL